MTFEAGTIQHDMGKLRKEGDFYLGLRRNATIRSVRNGEESYTNTNCSKINFLTLKEIGAIILTGGIIGALIPVAQALLH